MDRIELWTDTNKGIKSRLKQEVRPPAVSRTDISDAVVQSKIERGDLAQQLRLRFYPSIDVDIDKLYAGEIEGSLEDAEEALFQIGFRNNPTAYVEITEEHGPDDGSYSRQIIIEEGVSLLETKILPQPTLFKRAKDQYHITVYELDDGRVILLAHKERSAWLQPARHVWLNDSAARTGVRDFRDMWYDEFGEELGGGSRVEWDTTH